MDYELTFEDRGSFLYVRVRGSNSPNAVAGYLADVVEECKRRDCRHVLIDERLEGPRLGVNEVFDVAAEGAMKAVGVLDALAYVDPKMGSMADFAESVALNRGMPVRTFASIDAAEAWLLRQVSGQNEQDIFTGDD